MYFLPVFFIIVGLSLSLAGSFMENKKLNHISRTAFLTIFIIVEFLLLEFNIFLKIILFIIQFSVIVIVVWDLIKISNKRRIVYLGVLFVMLISVGAMDIFNRIYYIPEYVNPLIYKNYQPFAERNMLVTLDEPADIDFDENYPLPKLDGATAMYPFYAAVYQELYDRNLDMSTYINCNSSEYAFDKLSEGEADIFIFGGYFGRSKREL
jgi:phosphate transport system substrate-binding protein